MGGDGGTLNNSRKEQLLLRKGVNGSPDLESELGKRSSVSECAISNKPLRPPNVVVDRAGQLYNKDALISFLLDRRAHPKRITKSFSHIRSIKRDTAPVRCSTGVATLVCPVTRKEVSREGRFTVGWTCGCVTAPVHDVPGLETFKTGSEEADDIECLACGERGPRVRLGLPLSERLELIDRFEHEGRHRGSKRKHTSSAATRPSKWLRHSRKQD